MSEHNPPAGVGELGPPKADFSAPPPYELTMSETLQQELNNHQQQQQQHHQHQPHHHRHHHNRNQQQLSPQQQQQLSPALQQEYEAALQQQLVVVEHGQLPTYEEVQMEKSLNGEMPPAFMSAHCLLQPTHHAPPPNPLLANLRDGGVDAAGVGAAAGPALTFIAIDATDPEHLTGNDNNLLGTDIMFVTAFMVAFLFNWIGFLLLTCFCHTIAARYGALSGFGLSLAKWTLIVKHSTDLASHENSWLWWLIMAFGFLICVRALIQYVSIKRTWRLLSTSAQERLLFFY